MRPKGSSDDLKNQAGTAVQSVGLPWTYRKWADRSVWTIGSGPDRRRLDDELVAEHGWPQVRQQAV